MKKPHNTKTYKRKTKLMQPMKNIRKLINGEKIEKDRQKAKDWKNTKNAKNAKRKIQKKSILSHLSALTEDLDNLNIFWNVDESQPLSRGHLELILIEKKPKLWKSPHCSLYDVWCHRSGANHIAKYKSNN